VPAATDASGRLLGCRELDQHHAPVLELAPGAPVIWWTWRSARPVLTAELLVTTSADPEWNVSPATMAALAARASRQGAVGQALARQLEQIRTCELLLGPAVAFFEHALGCDGQKPNMIATKVRERWGHAPRETIDVSATEELEADLRAFPEDIESGSRWLHLARALHAADYEQALALTLEQNAAVMKVRAAAAPWADLRHGELLVRFRDEQSSTLPSGAELPDYWRHAYFIESLRGVALALRE